MNCEDKQTAFQDKLASAQLQLKAELEAIATDTEAKANEIADDFEKEHKTAEDVGAGIGTVVGAVFGDETGQILGEPIGKLIGSLFTMEIGMRRQTVSLDVPQTTMRTQDFSFDMPTVVMHDTDIIFDLPTIEMRRQRGPDIPETRTRMEERCIGGGWSRICADVPVVYVEMTPTYFDMPVTVMKPNRIVVGLPSVEMRRQEFKMDIPEITMKPTEFSMDIPFITLRFLKDAGKRTASMAAALAQSAQDAARQKQIAFRERLKLEVAPLCVAMFACFRETIEVGRSEAASRFAGEIDKLSGAVAALKAQGVQDADAQFASAVGLLNDAIAKRDAALKPFDDAIEKLAASAKTSLDQFLETPPPGAKDLKVGGPIGLIRYTLDASKAGSKSAGRRYAIPGLISYSVEDRK